MPIPAEGDYQSRRDRRVLPTELLVFPTDLLVLPTDLPALPTDPLVLPTDPLVLPTDRRGLPTGPALRESELQGRQFFNLKTKRRPSSEIGTKIAIG